MYHKRISLFVVAVLLGCSTASIDPDCLNKGQRHGETLECCEAGAIIPLKDNVDCPASAGVNGFNAKIMVNIWHKERRECIFKLHLFRQCLAKCRFEALGLLNGEEINEDKLMEYVNRLDGPWKKEAIDAVSDCLDVLAAFNEHMAKSKNRMPCHHAAGVMSTCLIRKTVDLCPYADWRDSTYCIKLRSNYCFKNDLIEKDRY
ncbi:uncharacterized protein LOC118464765 isoform X1 [Anopheles albimanus]|uniref:uncharacterized protein LOC118464765 isoform X1 n=1 Tax=Anopheles albimanus TaxID=7167 RepID=UPI00163F6D84|nr:uncharacterized protein LOC118464765 isoform X1 [Anopheles albimanus]